MTKNLSLTLGAVWCLLAPVGCGGGAVHGGSGAAGAQGTAGAPGTAGATSSAGSSGSAGAVGTAGGSGSVGSAGVGGTSGSTGSAGGVGSAGAFGTAGAGAAGASGAGGQRPDGGTDAAAGKDGGTSDVPIATAKFSFFVTSLKALQKLSNNPQGFGGDLRFGETGAGAGLRGADKICSTIAETSMAGAGQKGWHAFLSAVTGEDGKQVNAIDRIGSGPWYDRLGRTLALTKADLMSDRPKGDAAIINDFPNEDGVGNHAPDPGGGQVDNHDFLTGTGTTGQLYNQTGTCADWTGKAGTEGRPRCGHSWPRMGSGVNWMSVLDEGGCQPGVNLVEMGGPAKGVLTVGTGGGYGGFYCFAMLP